MTSADLELGLGLGMRPEQRTRLLVVISAQLLALPACELDEHLERVLAENPALDVTRRCAWCGRPSGRRRCARCRPAGSRRPPLRDTAAAGRQHLLAEAAAMLPGELRPVLELVVESLDGHGLLAGTSQDELCRVAGCSPAALRTVLVALRGAGPPGLATFDVRSCLLAQVDAHLESPRMAAAPGGRERWQLARRLVDGHLTAVAEGRFTELAGDLSVTEAAVAEAVALVRRPCSPYPAVELAEWDTPRAPAPDVVFRRVRSPHGGVTLTVDVQDPWEGAIRVSPDLAAAQRAADPAARAFACEHLAAARLLLAALDRRHGALQRVAAAVAHHHRDALLAGSRSFSTLSRRDVARAVGLHESTVSRAVKDRSVQLPDGQVVPFAELFGSAREVRQVLAELIGSGAGSSDRELADLLAARGFQVARRTVAKYRTQIGPHRPVAHRKIASAAAPA